MDETWDAIKKHRYLIGAGLLGVLVLYFALRARAGSSAAATSGIDPQAAALASQGAQLQAAGTQQANQITGQLQLAGIQAGYGLQLAKLQSDTSLDIATLQTGADITKNNTAGDVALANIAEQGDVQSKSIAASLELGLGQLQVQNNITATQERTTAAQLATTQHLAELSASEQIHIADTSAALQDNIATLNADVQHGVLDLQSHISDNQTLVANTQTQAAVAIAKNKSNDSFWGNILGTAASVALAFI